MRKRIIDKRKKEKFVVDDEYLNGMARLCGWQGTIVYNSLCRHANINQESFPSIKTMMAQHNVGRNTIIKGIERLEKRKVIEVKKTRSKSGKWLNNTYILLDKSEWIYNPILTENKDNQVLEKDTVPSPSGDTAKSLWGHSQVPLEDLKETHRKETYKKDPPIVPQRGRERPSSFVSYEANNKRASAVDTEEQFERWWQLYPKKVGKGAALRIWKRVRPSLALQAKMRDVVEQFRHTEQWSQEGGKYIPNPATWLNQGRWDDEIPAPKITRTPY